MTSALDCADKPTERHAATRALDRITCSEQVRSIIEQVGDIEYKGGYNNAMIGAMMTQVNGTREESDKAYTYLSRALDWELVLLALSSIDEVPEDNIAWLKDQLHIILHGEFEAHRQVAHAIDSWANTLYKLQRKQAEERHQKRLQEILRELDEPPPPPMPRTFLPKFP